ncbi:ABC transporter ATP-binding protein [Methylorubrum extorquens]|uniref:Teichoic-acid-transporting ATPase n=1 Tax=Methylorubrum extorquens DSM 13060 TaxID=882800 RepID=H1KD80_METEX|nr:ABC transporter ATP-binding protein [Methylorubrum extorquens]EHP94511.1 Teichoic-acid-transporting ATPase [Methylorubrum extorquens DSM 13060]
MSPDLAIDVRSISKRFPVFGSSTDKMVEYLSYGLLRRRQEFQALRDVSFQIRRGECMGVLGTNGSGKSTLLQILAGTMRPSGGEASVRGRVAALLELGAGFSPDFTGRENALLNARLLGCSQEEAVAALPRIEAFAEIGDYIDQPVRTYSSGMYVRLAFAVASSVTPDVFIVDEALAVGDHVFQSRCYGRLRELREAGTTILFVSHDLTSVADLCDRAVWIDRGEARMVGDTKLVLDAYLSSLRARSFVTGETVPLEGVRAQVLDQDRPVADLALVGPRTGSAELHIVEAELRQAGTSGAPLTVAAGHPFELAVTVVATGRVREPNIWFRICTMRGSPLVGAGTLERGFRPGPLEAGQRLRATFVLDLPLQQGIYPVGLFATDGCHRGQHAMLDGMETAFFIDLGPRSGEPSMYLVDVSIPAAGSVEAPKTEIRRVTDAC